MAISSKIIAFAIILPQSEKKSMIFPENVGFFPL